MPRFSDPMELHRTILESEHKGTSFHVGFLPPFNQGKRVFVGTNSIIDRTRTVVRRGLTPQPPSENELRSVDLDNEDDCLQHTYCGNATTPPSYGSLFARAGLKPRRYNCSLPEC